MQPQLHNNKNIKYNTTASYINTQRPANFRTSSCTTDLAFTKTFQVIPKSKKKVQSEKTEQSSELHSNMTQMLELADKEFKITIINTLTDLMEKLDHMQAYMGNVSSKMETIREKYQR